jgi:hypothetical protein
MSEDERMATQVKVTELLIPRRNEYVRGSIKRDNLIRIASAFTGKGYPEALPPILVRKLVKPVKRGKREYKLAVVDGVHRATLALMSQSEAGLRKLNEMLRDRKLEAFKGGKIDALPARVEEMSETEAEVEQMRTNLAHGLLLDKKHRDAWARHLVKNRGIDVAKLARLLHLTERSVYRMVKGEQTKVGPRKKAARRAAEGNGAEAEAKAEKFTPESYFKTLRTMAKEAKANAPALTGYLKAHHEEIAKWLDPLVDVLNLTAAIEATGDRKAG